MRFTKIPLIATLMAVALSLLIVLPTIAQTTDITDGKLSAGDITVGVFANIGDAELTKLEPGGRQDENNQNIYVPMEPEPDAPDTGVPATVHSATTEPAHLMSDTSSPRDTLFRNTLYVSNDGGAFNTILVNVPSADPTCDVADETTANVTATVKNNRSGKSVTVQLVKSTTDNAQAFVKVVDELAKGALVNDAGQFLAESGGATVTDIDDAAMVPLTEHNGPTWCDDPSKTGTSRCRR